MNANGCVKYNIPFGTYHFAYFVDEKTAQDEANFAIKKANLYKNYVKFIALDIEQDSVAYAKRVGKNPNWTKCAIAFLEKVKKAGYIPVLYSNYNWIMNILDYDKLKQYKLWYAAPDAQSPKFNPTIWQYSWKGRVAGLMGDVDMDYLYDGSLITKSTSTSTTTQKETTTKTTNSTDLSKFLNQAKTYIGCNGRYVCLTKLKLGAVYDWCAFSVSSIMKDCGFIGKYVKDVYGGAGDIPRYSDGKFGTWYKKGTKTPQAGDLIFFRYSGVIPTDKYFSSHVGIVEKVEKNILTTLEGNVEGTNENWAETSTFKRKTRNLNDSDVYAFYRPNWDKTQDKKQPVKNSIDVYYQVHAKGQWLPNVKNLEDYAGLEKYPIQGIYMKPTKGHLRYRVKLIGSNDYLPWVTDREDYAGILGKNIDCVQIELLNCDGYDVQYRVSTTSSVNYLPWVKNYNNQNSNGYAGIKNTPIDKLQIRIVKK